MEGLQASLAAACPLPFSGATGNLFAGAVAAVVAAHCAFYNDVHWPKDNAADILAQNTEMVSFDFVVVGSGTAGSLLASRLASNHPSHTVLLLEAGDDPGLDTEVPAFVFLYHNTTVDWHYETEANEKSCQGIKNSRCVWSKGKAMGGSSAINVMIYVRGHPKDFDNWKNAGNEGWSYKDISGHFDQLEKDFEFYKYQYPENPWHGVMEASWLELNLTQHKKSSNEALTGIRVNKLMIKDGRRLNTARLYLKPFDNLRIMKNTLVQKVIIDADTKTATGVEIRHKNGIVMEIKANKEVILSAGSISTPQLLMLSGIGPKTHLEDKNIKCLVDLPVGQNLQDHIMLPLFLKTNLDTILKPEQITSYMIQYMLTRTGPFSNVGVSDLMALVDTTEQQGYPDLQFLHNYFTQKDNFTLRPFLEWYGYREEFIHAVLKLNEGSDLLGILPTLLHPKSKGEVLLADSNAASKPIIKANYFQHPDDLVTLMKGIEVIRKLEGTTVFKALGIQLPELDIKDCEDSAEYWVCYVKNMAVSIFHPVGTAKMGPKNDKTAVVSPELLVHGVKNLRVVDASIMPDITGSNTMAPTLMIAEKAAQIIKNHYEAKKDEL